MSEENSDDDAFESADEDELGRASLKPGIDFPKAKDAKSNSSRKNDGISLDSSPSETFPSAIAEGATSGSNVSEAGIGRDPAVTACNSKSVASAPPSAASVASGAASVPSSAALSPPSPASTPSGSTADQDPWSSWSNWGFRDVAEPDIAAAADVKLVAVDPTPDTSVASDSAAEGDSWSSWGNWGASLLTTASKSVSQFSTEVTEGLNVLVDVSTSDVEDSEKDEAAEKAALQVKEDVIESQPAFDIPALPTGRFATQVPGCPVPPPSTSSSTLSSSSISTLSSSTSTLSSFTSGLFASASSFDAASAAAGFSSAFGNLTQRNLPNLSAFSSVLSPSSTEGISSEPNLVSPSGAGEKLAGLMEGGLGVLEMVGRKTMDILKESDGGLELTRAIFHDRKGKPTLSDLLREGKTKSEAEDGGKEDILEERKNSFQYWFDEFKGMAHLEALELLNNSCETEIKEMLARNPDDSVKPALISIKDVFVKGDDDDNDETDDENDVFSFSEEEARVLRQMLRKHAEQFGPESATNTPVDSFVDAVEDAWRRVDEFDEKIESVEIGGGGGGGDETTLSTTPSTATSATPTSPSGSSPSSTSSATDPRSVHRACIENLANMVAKSVCLIHKIGQMTLIPSSSSSSNSSSNSSSDFSPSASSVDEFVERLSHLLFLSKLLTANIDGAATAFGQLLSKFGGRRSEIEINQVMTDIFLESSQGTSHVRSAFKLLLPVMQVRFLKEFQHRD